MDVGMHPTLGVIALLWVRGLSPADPPSANPPPDPERGTSKHGDAPAPWTSSCSVE